MNDDFSEQVYNSFIDGLDPNKRYFTQEDLKNFRNTNMKLTINYYKMIYLFTT